MLTGDAAPALRFSAGDAGPSPPDPGRIVTAGSAGVASPFQPGEEMAPPAPS